MHHDYDAVIVGARCAGAATALLLARRGHRVLLVDRAHFPSEIAQGHMIHRDGPMRLHRWGMLDRLVAAGCPPITSMTTDFGDYSLEVDGLQMGDVALGYGPRRGVFDKLLIDAAIEAGAELREGFSVEDVLWHDGSAVGVTGTSTIRARLVIGADGRHSRIARAVQASTYEEVPTLACWYFTYWSDVAFDALGVYDRGSHAIFAHPTTDGLVATFVGWPIGEFPSVRADVEGSVLRALGSVAGLKERLLSGRRVERFYGTADMPNFLRTPFGPGWALVGDAGCHKDPYLALGMRDALRDAELLADAAHAGLAGLRPMNAALAEYEAQRNAAVLPDYYENLSRARFEAYPDDVLRLRQVVRYSPADARQMMLAARGLIPREAFFNPKNLQRLFSAVAA